MIRIIIFIIFCFFLQGSTFVIDASQNAAIHNNQGVSFLHDNEYVAAINEFKIAIGLMPNKPATANYFNNLGLAYNAIKRYEWSQYCFERAVEINPNFFEYYENLVKTYKLRHALQKNLIKYRKKAKNDKENSTAWLFIGLINEELKMKPAAIEAFVKYTKIEPDIILTEAVNKHLFDIRD